MSVPDIESTPFTMNDGVKTYSLIPEKNTINFDVTSLYYTKYDSVFVGEGLMLFTLLALSFVLFSDYLRNKALLFNLLTPQYVLALLRSELS